MVELVASCRPLFFLGNGKPFRPNKLKVKLIKHRAHRLCVKAVLNSKQQSRKNDHMLHMCSSYEALFCESPQASFDQFVEDEHRLMAALCPDIEKSQLAETEWRIELQRMQILFLSFCIVVFVKLRYKSMGKDYPPHVPHHIPKIIELECTKWELGGFPDEYQPRDMNIALKGTIYPDREQGTQCRLKCQFDVDLIFTVSPLLRWIPHNAMHNITESNIDNIVSYGQLLETSMEDAALSSRLLEDYDDFKMMKLKDVS